MNKKNFYKLQLELNNLIKKYNPNPSEIIGILETIKIDVILNTGCVVIDGRALNFVEDDVAVRKSKAKKKMGRCFE